MASVLTFGETMGLVRADDLGGWETVSRASIGVGGADSNVAIGLRRLGVSSAWIGRVGDDALGVFLRSTMAIDTVASPRSAASSIPLARPASCSRSAEHPLTAA